MNAKPFFSYILRRWCAESNTAGQVVVITSWKPLTPPHIKARLEQVTQYPAEDFVELHIEPDADMVLDTWERFIETGLPVDMEFEPVKAFRGWWKEEMLKSHQEGEEC